MISIRFGTFFAAAALAFPVAGTASILYTFTGTTVSDDPSVPGGSTQSFTYLAPGFMGTDTLLGPGDLSSCTGCSASYLSNFFSPSDLPAVEFSPNQPECPLPECASDDVIAFGFLSDPSFTTELYYFAPGDFSTLGTFSTTDGNSGTLTVESGGFSRQFAPTGAPEAGTFGLALICLAGVGVWGRVRAGVRGR